ncbi:MAG: hypothetical protein ABSF26_18445 [Thermoguttaceae bacterium]
MRGKENTLSCRFPHGFPQFASRTTPWRTISTDALSWKPAPSRAASGAAVSPLWAAETGQPKPAQTSDNRKLKAQNGVICTVPGERLGYFGWPTLCRMGDGTLLMASSGLRMGHVCPYPSTVEMADGSLITAYYQQIRNSGENCSLLWSRWRLPE